MISSWTEGEHKQTEYYGILIVNEAIAGLPVHCEALEV